MALVCLSITLAWQYAEKGPFTSSPARQLASSETVIFSEERVFVTTTHVMTPAIAMTIPTTMAAIEANLLIWHAPSRRPWAGRQMHGKRRHPRYWGEGGSGRPEWVVSIEWWS